MIIKLPVIYSFYNHIHQDTKSARLIGPISYLGAYYIRKKVTKCIRESIKSHSPGYEICPINREKMTQLLFNY